MESDEEIERDERVVALAGAMQADVGELASYSSYVLGESSFDTHQGVKGLEFERVMVMMDDEQARGFMFGYDKLFGAKELSKRDMENEAAGYDSGLARTRRLFYVTASRAQKSLALILYTVSPDAARQHVIHNKWFAEAEVVTLG